MTTTDQLTAALTALEQQLTEDKNQLPALAAVATECGDDFVLLVPDEDTECLRPRKQAPPPPPAALWLGVRG